MRTNGCAFADPTRARPLIDLGVDEVVLFLASDRPKVHDEAHGTRIVLGDWYEQGSVLRVDRDGYRLAALA